ncbi:hypothetical protein ACP275_07G071700 [Erythranthe tilingii]
MKQLPIEVLEEILSKLHVKDLLRFKSVSKNWNSIISSQSFINLHLKKSISSSSHFRVFEPYGETLKTIEYHKDLRPDVKEQPKPLEIVGEFEGTSDGLICYFNKFNMRMCVWNPALRVSKTVDLDVHTGLYTTVLFFWFGRESPDEDFKVVLGIRLFRVENRNRMYLIKPFDGNCVSELIPHEIDHLYSYRGGTLLSGTVHWLMSRTRIDIVGQLINHCALLTFNLGSKSVGEISMPVGFNSIHGSIGVIDGCLSAIFNVSEADHAVFEVWTMKEYGVLESWTKLTVLSSGIDDGISSSSRVLLFGATVDGDLVLGCSQSCQLLVYNVAEKKSKILLYWCCGIGGMYVETMVSPQCKNNTKG